eukprot:5851346-Alexandrium_andersonii.AAC.1
MHGPGRCGPLGWLWGPGERAQAEAAGDRGPLPVNGHESLGRAVVAEPLAMEIIEGVLVELLGPARNLCQVHALEDALEVVHRGRPVLAAPPGKHRGPSATLN